MFCIQINNVKVHKKAQTPIVIISTCTKMHADVSRGSKLYSCLSSVAADCSETVEPAVPAVSPFLQVN